MNAMEWNRDLRCTVQKLRESERDSNDKPDRGKGTVSFPAMRDGNIGLTIATQIARYVAPGSPLPGWHSQAQAWAHTQGQLAWYRAMEEVGELVQITDAASLDQHLARWSKDDAAKPIGYVLSLEGADSLVSMKHLERSYAAGLRAIGPAHYGPGIYAQGTGATGGIGSKGRELLKEMEQLNIILDVTHLCDESFWQAIQIFPGPLWASHSNCRALVPHERQLTDQQIMELVGRNAVIGVSLDAWMLVPDWRKGVSTPEHHNLTLEHVCAHVDHICQLAGSSRFAGIGSDLDGGYGKEQTPHDLDTIADIGAIAERLIKRGYSDEDIRRILSGNVIEFLRGVWR